MNNRYMLLLTPIFVTIVVLFTGGMLFSYKDISSISGTLQAADQEKYREEKGYYRLMNLPSGKVRFENDQRGYTIQLPREFRINIDQLDMAVVFKNDTMQIEIYEQLLEPGVSESVYVNYSNQFLEDRNVHKLEKKKIMQVNGKKVYITKWTRDKLKGVNPDYNHYVSADICLSAEKIFSIFVKSTEPLSHEEDYMDIISSFQYTGNKLETNQAAARISQKGFIRDYWTEKTRAVYNKYFIENNNLTWGIFQHDAPVSFDALEAIEENVDYVFPFLVYYQHFSRQGISRELSLGLNMAKEKGRILELTLQTTEDKRGNMVYRILNGEFDGYLREFAGAVRENAFPVLMRFCNEMNGDWCEYSSFHTSKDTRLYKELYRYVFELFRQEEALPYMIWVWNPNEKSFPDFAWNHESMYYPGDKYVDVVGLTGYNTGNYYRGEKWRSFTEIYEEYYHRIIEQYRQPLMITEFSSSSVGGDKAKWVEDMFKNIKKYRRIKVAIWWSGRDLDSHGNVARPYWIDETQEILHMFKKNLQ